MTRVLKLRSLLCLLLGLSLQPLASQAQQSPAPTPSAEDDPHAHHKHHQTAEITSWTQMPVLKATPQQNRRAKVYGWENIQQPTLLVYPSSKEDSATPWSLTPDDDSARLKARKNGGYHWLIAQQQTDETIITANTVVYFSRPGPNPVSLLTTHKSILEITPVTLPREHRRYRAGERWPFEIRYHGRPLPGVEVIFKNAQGTQQHYTSDDNGRFMLHFPDDFSLLDGSNGGHHGRPKIDFVISVEWYQDGKTLLSSFNYTYGENAFANTSRWLGAGFMLFGMLAASPLIRRKKERKHSKSRSTAGGKS